MAAAKRTRREKAPPQTLFRLGLDARGNPDAGAAYEKARRQKYRDLFNTLLGREVLADLLGALGYFAADPPTDGELAIYRNGMRAGAAEILKAMGVDDPANLLTAMLNDNISEIFDET